MMIFSLSSYEMKSRKKLRRLEVRIMKETRKRRWRQRKKIGERKRIFVVLLLILLLLFSDTLSEITLDIPLH
jgi:hypothetical protein